MDKTRFKILMVGDSGVGKSSLLMRFSDNNFSNTYTNTVGIDYVNKSVEIEGETVELRIWDTAGQEKFRSIVSNYYRGTHGVVIVYDVTSQNSFDGIKRWIAEIFRYGHENVAIVVVGNKIDLDNGRTVCSDTAREFADGVGVSFLETSAKNSVNVSRVFETITEKIRKAFVAGVEPQPVSPPVLALRVDEETVEDNCCYRF